MNATDAAETMTFDYCMSRSAAGEICDRNEIQMTTSQLKNSEVSEEEKNVLIESFTDH